MDNTNQILAWIAAVLIAAASVLATLGHKTSPYVLIVLSAILASLIFCREVWQRKSPKTDSSNLLTDSSENEAITSPIYLKLKTPIELQKISNTASKKAPPLNTYEPPDDEATQRLPVPKLDTSEAETQPMDANAKPNVFENEYDKLSKDHVRLKIQNERLLDEIEKKKLETTKLQHDELLDEATTKRIAPTNSAKPQKEETLDPNKPVYPPYFFHTGSESNTWTEYTEDVFSDISADILWRWHYKPEIDNTPRNITPHCLECENPRLLQVETVQNQKMGIYTLCFICPFHQQRHFKSFQLTPLGKPLDPIKEIIQKKLQDGSWIDIVNKQRMARHQSSISPDVHVPKHLEEIKEEILTAIAMRGVSCSEGDFDDQIRILLYKKQKPFYSEVTIDFHLKELEEQGFLMIYNVRYDRDSYELTQKGKKYVIDNGLISN